MEEIKHYLDNEEAIKLRKEIAEIEKKIINYSAKYNAIIQKKKKRISKVCTHNHTKEEFRHIHGSYLERCEYIKKIVCQVCGKVIGEERTIGGYE